jgi:hypothetical protein
MRIRKDRDELRTVRVLLGLPKSFPPYETPLIEKCEAALETPLDELSLQQMRLLINQGIGLDLLMPRALDVLDRDPAISVTFFEGDLLRACLTAPPEFWSRRGEQAARLAGIARRARLDDRFVTDALEAFMQSLEMNP